MFTNLIESGADISAFKRRSSFFLITVLAYVIILFAAGIASIYAYDAQLETQTSSLELLNWVPPVNRDTPPPTRENHPQSARRSSSTNAPIDRHITMSERIVAVAPTTDPRAVPDNIGVVASNVPPVIGPVRLSNRNVDPPPIAGNDACVTCTSTAATVTVTDKPPEPTPVKLPITERVPSTILVSKAISLPQPAYPAMAKQIHVQGTVSVQILVDEQGKVISAQSVAGHPLLVNAAREAALRARFTPTVLNGQPVKIQGVITYNFVMQ